MQWDHCCYSAEERLRSVLSSGDNCQSGVNIKLSSLSPLLGSAGAERILCFQPCLISIINVATTESLNLENKWAVSLFKTFTGLYCPATRWARRVRSSSTFWEISAGSAGRCPNVKQIERAHHHSPPPPTLRAILITFPYGVSVRE